LNKNEIKTDISSAVFLAGKKCAETIPAHHACPFEFVLPLYTLKTESVRVLWVTALLNCSLKSLKSGFILEVLVSYLNCQFEHMYTWSEELTPEVLNQHFSVTRINTCTHNTLKVLMQHFLECTACLLLGKFLSQLIRLVQVVVPGMLSII
jgi:hypothetical protein